MIRRLNSRLLSTVEFKGGPPPRIPDSLFVPTERPCRHPLSQTTVVVNDGWGYTPAPFLMNHHLPRIVPFNIIGGRTIVVQPMSRTSPSNRNKVTFRKGAPASLSTMIPPLGNG